MRKFLLLSILCPFLAVSQQRFHVTLFGGFSNYAGDLQDHQFTLQQSNFAFGAGIKYDFSPHLALRLAYNHGTIEGDDKKSSDPLLRGRNLSFASKINEGSLLLEYTILNLEDRKVSPYIYSGVSVFHFNPYAYDTVGNKVFLKPLSTEGQGLSQYPSQKPYELSQWAMAFSTGVKFAVTDEIIVGFELNQRKTFTDYLDDVSSFYVDANTLMQAKGAKAVELAWRGDELPGNNLYPAHGEQRRHNNE